MTKDEKLQRALDQLKRAMVGDEHERTWRDREVSAEDAQRAMSFLRLHEELIRGPYESDLTRAVGRVGRRLEVLEAEIASVRREEEALVKRLCDRETCDMRRNRAALRGNR